MNSNAQFYFLSDSYFLDFPDEKLMKNKPLAGGKPHQRPCFYAFKDNRNPSIYWVVPVSSKIAKYKAKEKKELKRYGRCNSVCFGKLLGRETAFLIQNMCPAKARYMSEYLDKKGHPVRIGTLLAKRIRKKASLALKLSMGGAKVIYPDVMKIYRILDSEGSNP